MIQHRWLLALAILLTNVSVWAQPLGGSAGVARSMGEELQDRNMKDEPLTSKDVDKPVFELPKLLPEDNANQPISQKLKIYCRKIKLTGNTVFPAEELEKITAAYLNREITNQELQQLRHDLTKHYVDQGYINSGAIIPDQAVNDGIIEIQVIEGKLEKIELEGNEHFRESFLRDRIELNANNPLQVKRLQENLQLLLESPQIERINADLRPGPQPGTAVLKTVLKEQTPYQFGAVFDNQIAPSIGSYQGTVYASHKNLTGHGDTFSAQGRFAEGLTGYGLDYWLPVNRYDTAFHAWYSFYDSEVVERPFNQIDVTSDSEAYGISLSHPFYRKPGESLTGSISMERRRSHTFLFNQPFSFSPGVQKGESSVTVLRIGQEWLSRTTNQVLALRSTFNIGLDTLDATINQTGPDGRFFTWLGQLQWARLVGDGQLIWRTDLQVANDPLLPIEKFQIGGANSVRGYRENQIVRDWGFSASLEYRYSVLDDYVGHNKLFIAPFADVGGAWDVSTPRPPGAPDILTSVGLGLIWEPHKQLHTHVYWGKALINANNPDQDPQDYGFHFKVSGQLF